MEMSQSSLIAATIDGVRRGFPASLPSPLSSCVLLCFYMNNLKSLPTVSTTELQKHIKDTLKRVSYGEPILVNSNGFPVAVLVSPAQYQSLISPEKQAETKK
jgi:prevent-host-death family protein